MGFQLCLEKIARIAVMLHCNSKVDVFANCGSLVTVNHSIYQQSGIVVVMNITGFSWGC